MINDYYFDVITKQQSSELHAQADQDRLAKQVQKDRRAARRETARLADAVNGPRAGFWASLRELLTPSGSIARTAPRPTAEPQPGPQPEVGPALDQQQVGSDERVPVEH